MKILILTVIIINFANSFPYNGSQEIQNQTNQHFPANPPLFNHTARQLSSILSTEENTPTEDSNNYSEPTDGITRISGSLLERNHTKTHQASLYNFLPFWGDALSNSSTNLTSASFAYVEKTVANSQADPPKNTASPSTWDASAIGTIVSSLEPDSQMTQRRMAFSRKNSISAPVSMANYQYKSDFTAIPHFQTNSKTTQRLEPFFPSTSKSKPFFASYPVTYFQNAKEELTALADEGTITKSNANSLFGTGTMSHEDEAGPESIFFFDTIALMAEGNTAKIDAIAIPEEEYITLFDVPGPEDNIIIIDTAYQERYGKTMGNEPNLPKKDKYFVVDTLNLKNDGGSTVNAQTPSIFSAKTSNDFESTPILNTTPNSEYRDDSKSIMFATDNDEAIFSVNSINTTNYFHNARMHNDKNSVDNNSTGSKTMIDGTKSKMHMGDLIISKTNGITSTKHYVNPNHLEPITNTKITWPSKEDTITKGRHTVQMENIIISNNNNIAEAIGSKIGNSIINYPSNTHANIHLQTGWDNFKSVSTGEIENVTPMVEKIANMDQDDEDVEVLFIRPDTSIVEDSRKFYSLNPDSDYTQVTGNKITRPSDNPVFNLLLKYKMKPFTMDSKSITNNRVDHGNPAIITSNDTETKMNFEGTKTSVFKTDNFQNNITSTVSITRPTNAGSAYFSEDNVPGVTSASKISIPSSDQYTYSRDKAISLSTNENTVDGVVGPNPETDFPMNQIYILPSSAELSKIMSNALNEEAQIYMLSKDDYLTDSWRKIPDPGAENPHLTNDAIIHNKALADPLNIPQKAAFLIADFVSPSNAYNAIANGGERNTNINDMSEVMSNKATTAEGRPNAATTSLPAKIVRILIPNKKNFSLIAKAVANEEESIPYKGVESVVEEDGIVQMKENIQSAHNSRYFDSGDNVLERNGVVDSVNSLSQFSTIPTTKVINERDLVIPGKENLNVVYDVTNPINDKVYFKPMATQTTVNSLGESVGVTQNVETVDGTAFPPPRNSVPQTVTIDYSSLPNMYYNVNTNNPLITKENPSVAWNTIKNKLPFSTMDNVDLIGHRGDYQIPSNTNRLANIGKIGVTEIKNIPLGIMNGADNIFDEDENTKVVADLASITAASPIKTDIFTMNEVNTLYNKPNKLGHGLSMSREDPSVSRDDSTVSITDSNAFRKSESPFKHPQVINPVKKTSLADIIIPKTYFRNKSTPTAWKVAVTTASQGDVETMFYIPRYESEDSFQEDITLNSEADIQKEESTMAEEEDILEENVRDYIYVIPIASDNIPKGNNVAAKHYSTNSNAYDSTRFRGITKATADLPAFEDIASSYAAEASKPLLGKFIPKVQRKMIIKNSNSGSDHAEFFGGDIFNPIMKENIPKGDIFTPERESTLMTSDFSIPMKDNIDPGKVTKDVIKTNLMVSLNLVNSTKMPPNATIISPNTPAFKFKESNENKDTTMPSINGLMPIKFKSLLSPKKKISRTEFPLSENDNFVSDTAVTTLEASEPLSEHYTITDQNWEIINELSAHQPFSNVPFFPLADPTTFSEKPIRVATDRHTTGNGGINENTDTVALSPNIVLQTIIHKKRGINKTSDYDVHQAAGSPSEKETATSGTEASVNLGKEKATLEEESFVSEASTPVNLRELNAMKVNPSIFKPEAAFTEQKAPGNSKETFYPDSTMSKTKLKEVRDKDSFSFDNDNLKQSVINSYNKLYHIPLKSTLYPTALIKNSNSEPDLALVLGEHNMKMTGDSIIPNDIIVLSDNEIISPDNIIFIEDIRSIVSGKSYADSIGKDHITQYEVIPFLNDFSADSDTIFLAGENNPNNMDLTAIGLDDSTIDYVSKENVFYAGEEGTSPTGKKTTSDQGKIYEGFRSPIPSSTAHAIENILKENPGRLKSRQKYQVLISRERNPDSDNNVSFLQDDIAKFYRKSPNIMTTHPLTNEKGNFSPTLSDDLTLEMGSPSERDIIIPSESKWTELIHAPDPESRVTLGKSRTLPGDTPHLTRSSTPIKNREEFYGKGISVATYNVLREAEDTISPKSEHNKDKTLKSESYNSQNIIAPSIAYVSLDSEFPLVYDNSETNNFKDSASLPMKSTYTMADIIALSPENSYEGSDSMPPHENDRSRELPLVPPTGSVILIPKALTKNSVLMRENPLTDSSRSISVLSEAETKFLDLINETDISENLGIKMQKDVNSHSLNSIINSRNSATFIRNSTIDNNDDSSSVERETVDISKIKAAAHPQGTMAKILPPKQMNSFLSGTREMAKPSVAEDTIANFNISHIMNAGILLPALETALLSTSEPSILSKRNNSEQENHISEADNFVLRDLHTLKRNSSFGKFNISAGFQTPLVLKRILLADSTMSPEKTLKPKDNNFASPNEGTGTEGLFYNAPSESYGRTWNSIPSTSDATLISSSKYSELDPLVKMKKDTNTKTNNLLEKRNNPTQEVISPGTKSMLNTIFNNRFVGKDITTDYEVVPIMKNILDITREGKNIPNNKNLISTVFDDRTLEYVTNEYVFEPQEENYNPVIKKTALSHNPKIVESYPSYSSADASENLSQEAPTGVKIKKKLQNLINRVEPTSSGLGAMIPKSSTKNFSSKTLRSMTYPLTHKTENVHKFIDKTILESNLIGEDDTIIILPKDKRMEDTLVPNPETMVTKLERGMFSDETINPIVINSPIKNKNRFYRKFISSPMYNTNIQDKAENTLPFRINNVKKTNMVEMPHSQDSIIPLTEFSIAPDDELSFINEDTKVVSNGASVSFSPINSIHTMEDTIILSPEGNYEGSDSMLPREDNTRYKGSLGVQTHEKPMPIPNASRSVIYSLTGPNWTFSPEFYEAVLESEPLIGDNTVIILPKGKRMDSPLVPDPELVSTITESRMFTADPIDSSVTTIPIEYIDQLNMKGISSAFYNNVAPHVAKTTMSNRFGANKHETNLADTSYSQDVVPLAMFSVIPDGDLPFITEDTNEANNRASIFSSSMNKAISTMEDSSVLPNEGSYIRAKSILPGEDNVESKGFPSPLPSVIFIPNSLTENTETSGLVRDNTFSDSSIVMSEVLERVTEYANANNGDNIPEGKTTTQTDIRSYPLARNVSPMESTFLDTSTDGEVDSFFSLNDPDNYKTKTDKTYSKSQKAMTKAYYPIEGFQNSVHKIRKTVNLSDQEDPAAKFKLSHIKNTKVLIPAMEKTFLPASKSNNLFNGDNMDEEFHVSEVGNLFSEKTSTLNDKIASTRGSFAKPPIGSYALRQRSAIPPSDFTTSVSTPKYSEFVPIFTRGKDPPKKIDYNFPSKEAVISSDQVIILPISTSSKRDTAITFKGNIFENRDFTERETATEDEIIDFTKDISKKVDDISAGNISPAYGDHIIITPEDSSSEYVSDNYAFELEDKAKNSFIKMSTPSYATNSRGSHTPYTTITVSDSLPKTTPSEFKTKGNYQAIMPRQENKNIDITFTKSNANVNNKVHKSTTHSQTDTSKDFPSRFSEKTSVEKGTTNGDDDTLILSENSDLGNRITKYSIFQGLKPRVNSKTFTTDTPNHTVKNSYNSLKKDMLPTIYKIFTPRESDPTTSSIPDLAEDETSLILASDSRFSTFPLARLSSDDIFNIEENTEGAINTALTSFSPLRKVSTIMPATPVISIKDKINIGHSSLPSSESARSLRFIPIPAAPESAFSDSVNFNGGVVSTRQNSGSQRIPKILYVIYTVSQDDFTGSSDNITDIEPNTSITTDIRDKYFYTDASGDQTAEPNKTMTNFYTFFPNEHVEPNFNYTKEMTEASRMKDATTEFEANHLTDVNILRNDIVIKMETNSLQDTDLNPYLVSKNLTSGDKSVNKDYNSVSKAIYSSSSIPKDSHLVTSVPQENNSLAGDSNLFTEVIIIPTNETSSSYPEIISPMGENYDLEFNMANVRTSNSEFQALENMNIIRVPIVIEKILPKLQEISTVQQTNKNVEENTLFRAHIPQLQKKKVTPKDIPEESTNDRANIRVITEPPVNTVFLGKKEIVTPQDSTSFYYNFLSHIPKIQITGGNEDKNINVDKNNSQNVIAPVTSFTVSEDGNYFMIEDID